MLYFTSRYMVKVRRICHHFRKCKRFFSSDNATFSLEQLQNRKLLEIKGADATEFLQGLVTNDIGLLEDDTCKILYSVMLNRQGRILYDLLISSRSTENGREYLTECDHEVVDELIKLLKMYKLRKKISIELTDDLCAWAVIPNSNVKSGSNFDAKTVLPSTPVLCSPILPPLSTIFEKVKKIKENSAELLNDPRVSDLGARLYLERGTVPSDVYDLGVNEINGINSPYTSLRYQLGVGEGIADLPPGKALPLESNVDFLHGVSFHKGCYIGQELTARTYHTGVIRKRLVPFSLDDQLNVAPRLDSPIEDENGKAVGKFRNIHSKHGLALMRLQEASKAKVLKIVGSANITMKMPYWWPYSSVES